MSTLRNVFQDEKLEAGCDEAGRGCLAGPVVCAAVILPKSFEHPLLNDSKQLTEKKRELLRPIIEENALDYKVWFMDEAAIQTLNILKASLTGMQHAAFALDPQPELILVDGNKVLLDQSIPSIAIVKGDGKFLHIAAASILAKTYRDEYMEKIHLEFPQYKWNINKGYPTKEHRAAIAKYGPTIHHRMGFNLLGTAQLQLDL